MSPFVRLRWEPGLYGVTKLCWRDWPTRNLLSWVVATVFIAGAAALLLTRW